MGCDEIKHSTDIALRININLFAVQQSIDHIQMCPPCSRNQCGPSIYLHFFTISKILMKNSLHI